MPTRVRRSLRPSNGCVPSINRRTVTLHALASRLKRCPTAVRLALPVSTAPPRHDGSRLRHQASAMPDAKLGFAQVVDSTHRVITSSSGGGLAGLDWVVAKEDSQINKLSAWQ